MNIHSKGKNKIVVELSEKDMLELDITYEEMDYSKIETRRVIWTILQKVRDNTGRDIDPSGNLLIEAAADSHGGCVLNFTVPEKREAAQRRELKLTKNNGGTIYEFCCADDLLDVIKKLEPAVQRQKRQLFTSEGKYRLIMPSLPSGREKRLFEEYAKAFYCDPLIISCTLEHWQSAGYI